MSNSSVAYVGDSLFVINNHTVDLEKIAQLIVGGQDGDTVARLIREYSDHTCEYHGEDVWRIDENADYDDNETVDLLYEVLMGIDNEDLLTRIVEDYYPAS